MIKILFSDLDGTLLYIPPVLTSGVSEENRAAIRRLQDHGVRFAIATGRSVNFLPLHFGSDLVFDTVGICGASIRLNGRFIYQTDFDHDEIDALLEVFSDSAYEHRFLVVTQDNDYIFEDPFGEQAMEYKLNPKHRIRDCRQVLDESISEYIRDPHHTHITACFCHFQQEEGVDYYKDMLKRKFFGRYQIIQTSPYSIVILKDGANKGTGIAKIAALTGVGLDEIAVVGDSENDFEMFAMIPHSYCMSHARPDIQAKAKTIVDSVAECIDLILKENEQERLENLNLL